MNEIKNTECQVIGNTLIKNENPLANGIIKRKEHFNQKYNVDFSWFDNKNTKEFAYFLGFFYADGSNNEHNGHLTISLKENDKEILEQFSSLFFGNRPVYVYNAKCQTNNSVRIASLTVVNKSLSKIMLDCGAMQCKTFKIRFPYWLDKSLYKHFIRGYFDGDGSCMKCGREYRLSIASNWEFNHQLQNIIFKETGLKFGIIRQGKISILYKGGNNNTRKFLDWIYDNAPICLKRKHDRYKELLLEQERVKKMFTYVSFRKSRNYWQFRLPSKYGRKYVGGFNTAEDATLAYKSKMESYK